MITALGAGGICDSFDLDLLVAEDVRASGATDSGRSFCGGRLPDVTGDVGGTLATVFAEGAVDIRVEGGGGGFCGAGGIRLGDRDSTNSAEEMTSTVGDGAVEKPT
jgi:hypothetical protein